MGDRRLGCSPRVILSRVLQVLDIYTAPSISVVTDGNFSGKCDQNLFIDKVSLSIYQFPKIILYTTPSIWLVNAVN